MRGEELAEKMEEQSHKQENITHIYSFVQSIEKVGEGSHTFKVHLETDIINSKTVVLATGVTHKKLGVYGEKEYDGKGVSYCAVCDGAFFRNKHVVVVGGGDSAIESALYLSNIAKKVTVVHRRNKLRAEKILESRAFKTDNIDFVWNADIQAINGKQDGLVDSLSYKDKNDKNLVKSISVDGIFVNIGVIPVTQYTKRYKDIILDDEGFVISNSKMETPIYGLYAIGDVRANSIRQVVTATGDGAIASESILKYLAREDF